MLLHHVDSLWLYINIIHAEWYWITLKVIKARLENNQFVSLWSTWANISEMVHGVTNVCMKHVYKFLYDISD